MTTNTRMISITPTPRQKQFLSSEADIVIYGGSNGGGKTFSLLLEPIRFAHIPGFDCVYFRRRRKDLTISGSAWPESVKIYPRYHAKANLTMLRWTFPSGSTVYMDGLAHDKDVENWATSQIGCLLFDQLEQFTANQFFGITERLRSMSGVTPYVRAGCNPDPDCFLHNDGRGTGTGLISWWIDQDGWAIPERSGVIRWFMRINENLMWGDSKEDLRANIDKTFKAQGAAPIEDRAFHPFSLTFIMATVYDNKPLLDKDPSYLAVLHNLPFVRRMRKLGEGDKGGNWNIRETAGNVFRREWFQDCGSLPNVGSQGDGEDEVRGCRFWDTAATAPSPTNPDPDWLAGSRWHRKGDDYYWINTTKMRGTPGEVESHIFTTAAMDGKDITIVIEGEPGSQSLLWAEAIKKKLTKKGYHVVVIPAKKSKVQRAMPYSALCEQRHIFIPDKEVYDVDWLEYAILQHENFPPKKASGKDDVVDTCSGAVNYLRDGGSLDSFTGDDDDIRNAVEANRAPKGVYTNNQNEPSGVDVYSPADDDDRRNPWEK